MQNITVTQSPKQQKEEAPKYPYIGIAAASTGQIVLFIGDREGTEIFSGEDTGDAGYHSTTWEEKHFTRYSGSITLTQD